MHLLVSSICMVICNVPYIIISPASFLKYIYIVGLTTSVLNHATRNRRLQILDRTVMTAGACIDLIYIRNSHEFMLWFAAIYFYFFSKVLKQLDEQSVYLHVLSHASVTVLHNYMLLNDSSTVHNLHAS